MATSEVTHQDIINTQLNAKIDIQNTKIDSFIEEMRDFKNEMRQQNEMRAAEISEMRQSFQNLQQAIVSMQNQNIFVIIGVIAIAVAVFLK